MTEGQASEAFRENESVLIRFIAARVRCRATAEDIGQETFVRLKSVSWAEVVNPRAFLFTIAANLIANHKEQARRHAELNEEAVELWWGGPEETTPERHALAEEELHRVWSALEALPERTRQVLIWSRFDDLTNTQIATRLGISSQAVDKHLRKAVDYLFVLKRAE
jgi:RNA polymerase sigma factor (sigma-70 family)